MELYSNSISEISKIISEQKDVVIYTSKIRVYTFFSNVNEANVYLFDINNVLNSLNSDEKVIISKYANYIRNKEKVIYEKDPEKDRIIKELKSYVSMYQNRKSIKISNKIGEILRWLKIK